LWSTLGNATSSACRRRSENNRSPTHAGAFYLLVAFFRHGPGLNGSKSATRKNAPGAPAAKMMAALDMAFGSALQEKDEVTNYDGILP